uniref:Uncharacterized protein n=1 Tax=Rhizophora mucronata TaxID=61149 RepID=A0A2P2NX73_RHIMU
MDIPLEIYKEFFVYYHAFSVSIKLMSSFIQAGKLRFVSLWSFCELIHQLFLSFVDTIGFLWCFES